MAFRVMATSERAMTLLLLFYCCCSLAAGAKNPPPEKKPLPTTLKQFSARIETTAHQLNATADYPPYKRYMTVHYDYTNRRARIDYDPVPHMPPKAFVRRYDLGFEWMVMEVRQRKLINRDILQKKQEVACACVWRGASRQGGCARDAPLR